MPLLSLEAITEDGPLPFCFHKHMGVKSLRGERYRRERGRAQLLKKWHSPRTQHKLTRIKWDQDGRLDLDLQSASEMTHPEAPWQFQGTVQRPRSGRWLKSWKYPPLPKNVLPLCGSAGKESICNAGDLGSIPGLGRFPGEGKGYSLLYSGLEDSMDCIVHGVAKSRTQLSDFHFPKNSWNNPPTHLHMTLPSL